MCGTFYISLYPCILHTLRVLYGRETLVELVMCLKRLITVAFVSSELFHLVNGRVRVGTIPVYRLSDTVTDTYSHTNIHTVL